MYLRSHGQATALSRLSTRYGHSATDANWVLAQTFYLLVLIHRPCTAEPTCRHWAGGGFFGAASCLVQTVAGAEDGRQGSKFQSWAQSRKPPLASFFPTELTAHSSDSSLTFQIRNRNRGFGKYLRVFGYLDPLGLMILQYAGHLKPYRSLTAKYAARHCFLLGDLAKSRVLKSTPQICVFIEVRHPVKTGSGSN